MLKDVKENMNIIKKEKKNTWREPNGTPIEKNIKYRLKINY